MDVHHSQVLSFQSTGYLLPGIHPARMNELHRLTVTNQHRLDLWNRFLNFLIWPSVASHFSYAFIGGGFVSIKPKPGDVDVILKTRTRYGPESLPALERFFSFGLENIREFYCVNLHFWVEGEPGGLTDTKTLFHYRKPERNTIEAHRHTRGIIRIDLQGITTKSYLKEHLAIPTLPVDRLPESLSSAGVDDESTSALRRPV